MTRYCSQIVVRGDRQEEESIILTYIAIFTTKSFRVAMALATHFDLEIKQFDVINIFVNIKRDQHSALVVCKLSDRFKALGMYVKVDQALYNIRDSPIL